MSYIDDNIAFQLKNGEHLSADKYFKIGKGDCDKYASVLTAVFRVIKKINPNLKNIYISNNGLGHYIKPHDWNSLVFLTPDKIILTHIDPTWYDNNGGLEGIRGYHVPQDDTELLARFYADIHDFDTSYQYYVRLLSQSSWEDEKAGFLSTMAYLSDQLSDKEKMDSVRKQYSDMNIQSTVNQMYEDDILYHSYRVEKKKGKKESAEQFKQELITKYPDSYWTEQVLKESSKESTTAP